MHYSIGYLFQGQQTPTERRRSVYYGKPFVSKVRTKEWKLQEETVSNAWNNVFFTKNQEENKLLSDFVWNLLKLPFGFFIGGSKAMRMAYELFSIEYDENPYRYSDIDIYCKNQENNCNLREMEEALYDLLEKSGLKYYINVKKYLLNIVFQNIYLPTIQIILHIKGTIDEFMEFIDLPNTQFAFTISDQNAQLHYTENAIFALHTKINIIYDPIFGTTFNRIIKYGQRGFLTVVMSPFGAERDPYQRVLSLFDTHDMIHDVSSVNRIYVDCCLKDIYCFQHFLYSDMDFYLAPTSFVDERFQIHRYLFHQNIRRSRTICILSHLHLPISTVKKTTTISCVRTQTIIGWNEDDGYIYDYTNCYRHTIFTKYTSSQHASMRYKDDERSMERHCYPEYKRSRKYNYKHMDIFPYYCILTGNELKRFCTRPLFYFDFLDTFLNKYGIFQEDETESSFKNIMSKCSKKDISMKLSQ
jgi:hypothetical protein